LIKVRLLAIIMAIVVFVISIIPCNGEEMLMSRIAVENISYRGENLTEIQVSWGGMAVSKTINGSYIDRVEFTFNKVNIRDRIEVAIIGGGRRVLNVTLLPSENGYIVRRLEMDPGVVVGRRFMVVEEVVYQIVVQWVLEPHRNVSRCYVDGDVVGCNNNSIQFIAIPDKTYDIKLYGDGFTVNSRMRMPREGRVEAVTEVIGNISNIEVEAYPCISIIKFEVNAPTIGSSPIKNLTDLGLRQRIEIINSSNSESTVRIFPVTPTTPNTQTTKTNTVTPTTDRSRPLPSIDPFRLFIFMTMSIAIIILTKGRIRIAMALLLIIAFILLWLGGFMS